MASDSAAQVPTRSRSLFSKRPAWAKPAQTSQQTDAPEELFTRRNLAPDELLKQQEERHKQEAEKAARRAAAKAEKEKRGPQGNDKEDGSKRLRISEDTYAAFGLPSPNKRSTSDLLAEETDEVAVNERVHLVKAKQTSGGPSQSNNIISIDSDNDDETTELLERARPQAQAERPSSPIDPNEEFPELVALARERLKQREAEAKAARTTPALPMPTLQTPPEHDPVIQVLITSPILNTKPLLVHRRLSQRLLEIRQVWCQRQGFTEEQTATVFLTYKLRRLYDVTTCKSLGIKVDADGNVIGERTSDFLQALGDDRSAEKVHLIALTDETFEEMKRKRAAERANASKAPGSFIPTETDEANDDDTAAPAEEEERKIRVLIKARGYNDYKLIVRPSTTCARMLSAFRRENQIDADRELVLTFDGEAIEPEDAVKDTEIEDMDNLEVHFRD